MANIDKIFRLEIIFVQHVTVQHIPTFFSFLLLWISATCLFGIAHVG